MCQYLKVLRQIVFTVLLLLHEARLLNKATVNFHKNSQNTQLLNVPRKNVVQAGGFLVSKALVFPEISAPNYIVLLYLDIAVPKSSTTLCCKNHT
jgi:hypothetical protein